jgi:hypothetical protein
MEQTNHQRKGVKSNAHAGKAFELKIKDYFQTQGLFLSENFEVEVGIGGKKKLHRYDLGSAQENIIVECKSHKWTEGGKVPVAKMTTWNEVMLYFHTSPRQFEKILIVLRDYSSKRKMTLAKYYLAKNGHFIPDGVQIWEYDDAKNEMVKLVTVETGLDGVRVNGITKAIK